MSNTKIRVPIRVLRKIIKEEVQRAQRAELLEMFPDLPPADWPEPSEDDMHYAESAERGLDALYAYFERDAADKAARRRVMDVLYKVQESDDL